MFPHVEPVPLDMTGETAHGWHERTGWDNTGMKVTGPDRAHSGLPSKLLGCGIFGQLWLDTPSIPLLDGFQDMIVHTNEWLTRV